MCETRATARGGARLGLRPKRRSRISPTENRRASMMSSPPGMMDLPTGSAGSPHEAVIADLVPLVAGQHHGVADAAGLPALAHQVIRTAVAMAQAEIVADLVRPRAGGLFGTEEARDRTVHALGVLVAGAVLRRAS